MIYFLVVFCQVGITARYRCNINYHRAGAHIFNHCLCNEYGRFTAGYLRSGNNDIRFLSMLMYLGALLGLELFRLHYCITTSFRSIGSTLYLNEFCTKAHYLFFHRRTNIEHFNNCTEAFCCCNSLQPCHTSSQYQYLGRRDTTRRSHEHGEVAAILHGRHQHSLVASNVGLRTKHIHCLCTCSTWYGVHTEHSVTFTGKVLHLLRIKQRLENAYYHRIFFDRGRNIV